MKAKIIMHNGNSFRFVAVIVLLFTFCTTGFSQTISQHSFSFNKKEQQKPNSEITSRYITQPQSKRSNTPEKSIQAETVTGTVTDAQSGETMPGVNILVKGTATGTSTNQDGDFKMEVPSLQDTLVVSFIGYQSQEVPISGQTE